MRPVSITSTRSALHRLFHEVGDPDHGNALLAVDAPAPHRTRPRRPTGSSMAVDSSNTMIFGRMASTPAMATRCFWPPESMDGDGSARSAMPTSRSASSTRRRISLGGHAHVFQAEGAVLFHDGRYDLIIRILKHHAAARAHLVRILRRQPARRPPSRCPNRAVKQRVQQLAPAWICRCRFCPAPPGIRRCTTSMDNIIHGRRLRCLHI